MIARLVSRSTKSYDRILSFRVLSKDLKQVSKIVWMSVQLSSQSVALKYPLLFYSSD